MSTLIAKPSLYTEEISDYLTTSDNQFGFKKGMSCAHAIYTLRSAIDYYVNCGSTVNVCSIDLSKAFDRMNHHVLFFFKDGQKNTS